MNKPIAAFLSLFLLLALLTSCSTFTPYNDEVSFIYMNTRNSNDVFGFMADGTFQLKEDGVTYFGRWGRNGPNIQVLYQDDIKSGQIELLKLNGSSFRHNGSSFNKLGRKQTGNFISAYMQGN